MGKGLGVGVGSPCINFVEYPPPLPGLKYASIADAPVHLTVPIFQPTQSRLQHHLGTLLSLSSDGSFQNRTKY